MTATGTGRREHDISITVASRADLPEALRVQRAAFTRVAAALDIPADRLPPLRETLADLERLHDTGFRFLVARNDDRLLGTVRAEQRPDGVVEVGRLAVDDGQQRRGIGSALMHSLEDSYPQARRFELFTDAEASEPLALYVKLGYALFREEVLHDVRLVWLAKDRD